MDVKNFEKYLTSISDVIIDSKDKDFEKHRKILEEIAKFSRTSNHPTTKTAATLVDKNGKKLNTASNSYPTDLGEYIEFAQELMKGNSAYRHNVINHCERAVLYSAANKGIKTDKTILYQLWIPCFDCLCGMITSGVEVMVFHKQYCVMIHEIYSNIVSDTNWGSELIDALKLLKGANIKLVLIDGEIGEKVIIREKEYNI